MLLLSPLIAQTQTNSPSVTIRSTVRLVQVDVVAKDKHGNAVADLGAKDFVLLDDGKPQKISRLSIERAALSTDGEKPTADPAKIGGLTTFSNTHPENAVPTVILFDVLNTSAEDQSATKKGLLQSLNRLKDGTPIALLILGDDLTVVSDFTTNTISLSKAATRGFGGRSEGFGPPLTARKTGNPTRDRAILHATSSAFRAENDERLARTLVALHLICRQLALMNGRKSLLWISGGLDTPGESTRVQDVIDELNDANVAVYTIDARGVLLDPEIGADTDTNDLTAPLQGEREIKRGDILAQIAASTGGMGYHNTNRLDGAIAQALNDRSVVYVLDYYPQHGDWHGRLHKLQVRVSRVGVRLRYRSSYRATLPDRPKTQEQQEMLAEAASTPLESSGIRFSVEVEPSRAGCANLVVRVPADEVQWKSQDGKMLAELQVWFIQKRATGEDLFTTHTRGDVALSAEGFEAAVRKGLLLASSLTLQRSATKVRVLLLDENSGQIGSVDVAVNSNIAVPPAH